MTAYGAQRKLGCEAVSFRFAPIPAIRRAVTEPLESTYNGRWLRLALSIGLALLFEIQ